MLPGYDYSWNGYYFVTVCSSSKQDICTDYKIHVGADTRPAPTICSFKSRSSEEYIKYIKRGNLDFLGKIRQQSF